MKRLFLSLTALALLGAGASRKCGRGEGVVQEEVIVGAVDVA